MILSQRWKEEFLLPLTPTIVSVTTREGNPLHQGEGLGGRVPSWTAGLSTAPNALKSASGSGGALFTRSQV